MNISDKVLLGALVKSISYMEDRLAQLEEHGHIHSGDKYLCHILDDILKGDDSRFELENSIGAMVNNKIKGSVTFSNYLVDIDEDYAISRYNSGEMDSCNLTYEMQKKIEFVKDWIKELEAKEVV